MPLINTAMTKMLSASEMLDIANELGLELMNELPSSMARNLVDGARRHGNLDDLFTFLKQYRPDYNFTPHLPELIAATFERGEMLNLCGRLGLTTKGLGLDANGLIGWDNNAYLRRQKAELAQENSEADAFLAAIAQAKPGLELTAFEKSADPPSQPDPIDNKQPELDPQRDDPPEKTYENLDISINKIGDTYLLEAEYEHGGEVKAINAELNLLQNPTFVALYDSLSTLSGNVKQARELGKLLWQHLFPTKIWGHFTKSSSDARSRHNSGLRVRLRIEPPEIGMLPWEYCYDEDSNFLALDRNYPLVRYIKHGSIPDKVAAPHPAKVLLVSASPSDMGKITAEEEAAFIYNELKPMEDKGELKIRHEDHITLDKLQSLVVDFRPHILHFIGHGEFDLEVGEGSLVLEDENGESHYVDPDTLSVTLAKTAPKIVILNACRTAQHDAASAFMGIAPALVRAEFPAVIAMQFAIPNVTAALFARQFYHYIAMGIPLDAAITEARINVYSQDKTFWAIPVLFMRAEDGVIWTKRPSGSGLV